MSGAAGWTPAVSPVVSGGAQMFVAPVDRNGGGAKTFDPARQGRFAVATPPSGWLALGAVAAMERKDTGTFAEIWTGAPATIGTRARSGSGASLQVTFAAWSKLAMALSSGSQQMNLLRTAAIFTAADSGGTPDSAAVLSGSTANSLRVPASFEVNAGDTVVVDADYAGQTGFLGSPMAGAYVASAARVNNDVHYLRRISFNLARVSSVVPDPNAATAQILVLSAPLPAGAPAGAMQVSVVVGCVDRVGGSFLGEWSALFVADGVAGDRVLLHYPRLQVAPGATETRQALATGLERWRLQASLLALPVTDGNDGDAVLCYRSYLPAPASTI
ncbi:hypothetical protein [Terriglobus aquaticus]|uniref:Uncharacterized protein n=1 Tax=Terriglobus aquaticus TaxID=940139 RepID=A0ABW9KF63_9BACT|nr:hypothetical protein [Terriglobus aquaticus]